MSESEHRGMLRDASAVLGSRLVLLSISVVLGIVTARLLGPEGKGIIATLLVYPAFVASLAEFGIRQAIILEVGRGKLPQARVLGAAILLFTVSSFVGVSAVSAILILLGNELITPAMMTAAAMLIPIQLSYKYSAGILLGRNRLSQFNRISWLPQFATLVFTVILVWALGLGVVGAMCAMLLGNLTISVWALLIVARSTEQRPMFDWSTLVSMVRTGFGYALALFVIGLNYRIDIVMMERLSGMADVGQYSIGVSVAELLWQVPAAIGLVVFVRGARSVSKAEFSRAVAGFFRVALVVSSLAGLALVALSEVVVSIAYGSEFLPAARVIVLLTPGIVAMVAHKVLNMDLAGRGKPLLVIRSFVPALVCNIVLNLLLIPRWGASGAAVASSISYFIGAVLFLFQYSREVEIPLRDILTYSRADFAFVGRAIERLTSKGAP